ncbi:alpha/beta fold hydrolase [Spirillospora sp. NPDC047279]|uniref:thioesterase II family protein n=1 Tax=Spirillospora sp. NPDC047279 TaxID=3155478 RepID=UPI0033FC5EF3
MADDRWLSSPEAEGAPPPPVRLVCFPPAGADPRSFLAWQPLLGEAAQVTAVCLPGRAHRAEEPPPASLADVADTVAALMTAGDDDRPYLLFGHSMGAITAFEVARRLDAAGARGLRHLVVSGCTAPRHNPSAYITWSDGRHGRPFAEAAAEFLGLPEEFVSAEGEVQDMLLADLRDDVRLFAAYRYRPAPPLTIPLTVICGGDDPHADRPAVEDWRHESESGARVHWPEGDHFYLDRDPGKVLDVLRPLTVAEHIEMI